jgi:4-amino-4-deoxy-L-arabinose transferase-like glycosyltransferase
MLGRRHPAVSAGLRWPPAWAGLLLIVAIGAALRFYQLGELPNGLYQDEAYNGLDAVQVLGGWRPLYFPANNGREPFFIYLVSASVAVFDRTPLAVRLPAAMLGTLLIPATYVLGRGLYDRRVGLLAAAIAAFTFWPIALSRIGLRAGALPVFMALSLGLAAWGWRLPPGHPRRMPLIALAGALYGFTFYTYLAARFTPLALFALLILWYIARRSTFPHPRLLAAFGLPAIVVALPLAVAALWQPEIALGRAGQVSILNPDINHGDLWGTLFHNLWAALGMYTWRGDDIARHNLPGRPVFDPLLGLLFWAGVFVAVRMAWRRRSMSASLILIWTAVLLVPTVLAEDTPHFLRAVGVLPVIFLFPAIAMAEAGSWLAARLRTRWALPVLATGLLAISLGWTARDYFWVYANQPDTAYLFQSAATELAQSSGVYLKGGSGRRLLLDRRFWNSFASVRFLLPEQPGLEFYTEGEALAQATGPMRLVAWPYEGLRPALGALPAGSLITPESGPLYRGDLEPEAYPLYARYDAEICPPAICDGRPLAEFAGGYQLLSATTQPGGDGLELVWSAAANGGALQVFVQALDGNGAIAAQADGPLGTELYPSDWWRPGEIVREVRKFRWAHPENAGGIVEIRIGLYDPVTNARLARADSELDYVIVAP